MTSITKMRLPAPCFGHTGGGNLSCLAQCPLDDRATLSMLVPEWAMVAAMNQSYRRERLRMDGANASHEDKGGGGGDPPARTGLLGGFDLFEGVSRTGLVEIERSCAIKRFAPQELIIDRDSLSRDVFFILAGKARVLNYSVTGREITFDDLGSGSYFGEIAAIDGKPRSAAVVAVEETVIAAISYQKFMDILAAHPPVAVRVMRRLARIVRAADERIMDLSTLAAHNRVHAELLRQARRSMTAGNTARIAPIPLHSEIASRVSTTRETVARVMNDLARRSLVARTKDALVIHDVRSLESMVEEVRG